MGSRNQIWQWPDETIWRKYCGFLDLTKEEFYEIQSELLQDELLLVHKSPLGQSLLEGRLPENMGEFRQACRLTTYRDYQPHLENQQESSLAEPPFCWDYSDASGREPRCVPYTKRGFETAVDNSLAALILSSANRKQVVNLRPQDRMFWGTSDQSSLLHNLACEMTQRFGFSNIHALSDYEPGEFGPKGEFDWGRGMTGGLDILVAPNSALIQLGEAFSNRRPAPWFHPSVFHPLGMLRLAKGYLKSKLLGRQMMPKDFWTPQVLLNWQLGESEMNRAAARYWGKPPYQPYYCPEGGVMGLPGWNRKGVTLIPYSNFYEFIPEDDYLKSWQDAEYHPQTVLFHELTEGCRYELVITNLHGMPFLRYRVGHLIKVIAQEDPEIGVRLPQIAFEGRCDQRLDRGALPPAKEADMVKAPAIAGTMEETEEFPAGLGDTGKAKKPALTKSA